MKYTLICDESSTIHRHLILGALVIPRVNHAILAAELKQWKESQGLAPESEFKWTKVSRLYLSRYKQMVEWFFQHLEANHLGFRCLVVDTSHGSWLEYGAGDKEKAFYKVYYHLLYQCVRRLALEEQGSSVLILLDEKRDRYPFYRPVLRKTLNAALKRDLGMQRPVCAIETRRSSGVKAEPLIQVVDVLIGAVGYVRNRFYERTGASKAKKALVEHIESRAGTHLRYDTYVTSPFNLWTFDVGMSMERKARWKALRKKTQKKDRPDSYRQ